MSLRAFRFELPLTPPVMLGGKLVSHREGILLHKENRWAEASPLPGFSRESMDDVVTQLRNGIAHNALGGDQLSAALRFGISSLATPHRAVSVPINALLQGSKSEILEKAKQLGKTNCPAVKVKVRHARDESELIHELRCLLGPDTRIRTDANRCWSFEEAAHFAECTRTANIEYIEEPLQDPSRLEELHAAVGVRYALDETLAETFQKLLGEGVSLDDFPNAAALVVKPTILGGRERIQELASSGKTLVFSASYESGIGIARVAQLAHEFAPQTPAGLDTYSWLRDDVLGERLSTNQWRLEIPATLDVQFQLLEELAL